MKTIHVTLILSLVIAAGCTTEKIHKTMRAKPVEISEFLPNQERLVRQPDTFPFHYFYLKENLPAYENVYVAPVSTETLRKSEGWAKLDHELSAQMGTKVDDLAAFTRTAYQKAFADQKLTGGRFKVVDRDDLPNTLVVEPAIVSIVPTKAELNAVGTAASIVLLMPIGIVTSAASAGAITVECRIRDAATKEIVAMYADTESDPKAVFNPASFTFMNSARINVKMIAGQTARLMAAEDYRTICRDFPIRFSALIKDAE